MIIIGIIFVAAVLLAAVAVRIWFKDLKRNAYQNGRFHKVQGANATPPHTVIPQVNKAYFDGYVSV